MKIVAGYTQDAIKALAVGRAISQGGVPQDVDKWAQWFDAQQCDHSKGQVKEVCRECPDRNSKGCGRVS